MPKRTVELPTQVMLAQPKPYPTALTESLSRLFAERKSVRAAYLALMLSFSPGTRPCLLIGIDAEEDFDDLSQDAGDVIMSVTAEPVNVIQVKADGDPLSNHLTEETTPFYRREK